MAQYVDGFVVPVPKRKLAAYRKMANLGKKIWLEYGAVEYVECVADDVKKGKWTSFPRSVKMKGGETVFFSWIVYRSRSDRNRIMKKVMQDPRMQIPPKDWPFDGKRMIYGGFRSLISSRKGAKTSRR
jgi:uncharacterized protein YbaA (DUF1428 family)